MKRSLGHLVTKIAVRYTDEGDVWLGIDDEWFQFTMIEALTFAEYLHERLEKERNEERNLPTTGLRMYIRIESNTYLITLEAIQRIRERMLQGVRGSKPYRDFADERLIYKRMKEPELQDFGITPKDYSLYTLKGNVSRDGHSLFESRVFWVFVAVVVVLFLILTDGVLTEALVLAAILLLLIVMAYGFITWLILVPAKLKRYRLLRSPVASRIKLYEEVLATYRKEAEKQHRKVERELLKAERQRREAERRRQEVERQRQRKLEQ